MLQRDFNVTLKIRSYDSALADEETSRLGRLVDADPLPVPHSIELRRLESFPRFMRHEDHHYQGRSRARPGPGADGLGEEGEPFLIWSSPEAKGHDEDFFDVRARSQGKVNLRRASPEMLDGFLNLAEAPAERVLTYAREWGVLGLCSHGLPCTHDHFRNRRRVSPNREEPCFPLGWDGLGGQEPVAAWWRYARLARAMLSTASRLRRSKPELDPAELWTLRDSPTSAEKRRHQGERRTQTERRTQGERRIQGERRTAQVGVWRREDGRLLVAPDQGQELCKHGWPLLARSVNRWLVDGDVRPWLVLRPHRAGPEPQIRLAAPWWLGSPSWGLFGALGMQLATAVGGTSYSQCDACGRAYRPVRMPAGGRGHYCPRQECQRAAASRRKRRSRAARSLGVGTC